MEIALNALASCWVFTIPFLIIILSVPQASFQLSITRFELIESRTLSFLKSHDFHPGPAAGWHSDA
jgi:hypothetical protein